MLPRDPLILALDMETADRARDLVGALGEQASFYKVGLELFSSAGMPFVDEILNSGKEVFLDLKFHDIGETVKRATAQVAKSGVSFLTVHGTRQVMQAAAEGRAGSSLRLLAVTVLTSLDDNDVQQDGYPFGVRELVNRRVNDALEFGIDGVIASPSEARHIRSEAHQKLLIVTPGVRSPGAATGDQKRVSSPAEALRNGADYLVIGRQVTRSEHPAAALAAIRSEIAGCGRCRDAAD